MTEVESFSSQITEDIQSVTTDDGMVIKMPVEKPHMLKDKWTLWYDVPAAKKATQQTWASNLKEICVISSVEEFWAMFQHIPKPSEVVLGGNYYLFRTGIKPMWEDPENAAGGKWSFNIARGTGSKLDHFWLLTMLGCISNAAGIERPEDSDIDTDKINDIHQDICGIVLSLRPKQDRISIWTKTSLNETFCIKIGEFFKAWCEYPQDIRGSYQPHSTEGKYSGSSRDKYIV